MLEITPALIAGRYHASTRDVPSDSEQPVAEDRGHIDPGALERSLQSLRESDDPDLESALEQVMHAARVLFHATGTGLMAINENAALGYVAATDAPGRILEETQERLGEGPCVDALVFNTVVQSRDLADDGRWPQLRGELPEQGVRAVLGVPVHLAGETVGSLDAYVDRPYEWDASEVRALEAYADLIGGLLASALRAQQHSRLVGQLQQALNNRVVIERAVGMLMGREGVDAVTAFNRLRQMARNRRERVASLAERVLQGEHLDRS